MRKFAYTQANKEQSNGSNTEATLILCGYSGERANFQRILFLLRIKISLSIVYKYGRR